MRYFAALVPLALAGFMGCASYQGSAQDVSQPALVRERGWSRVDGVQLVRQRGPKDCGAAALSMVLSHWSTTLSGGGDLKNGAEKAASDRATIERALRRDPRAGLSAGALRDYARHNGYSAFVFQGTFSDLEHEIGLGRPVLVGVHKPLSSGEVLAHYEVLIGLNSELGRVLTLDPARGMRSNDVRGFLAEWESAGQVTLVIFPERDAGSETLGRATLEPH